MNLDRDVSRGDEAAFGPASVVAGAILPYEGRSRVRRADGPWEDALSIAEDGWLPPSVPVLVRGDARILPLAWLGDPQSGSRGVTAEEIAEFATQMEGSGYYWARSGSTLAELDEHRGDSIASYARALGQAAATKATFWTVSTTVGIGLVRAGDEETGTASLALHIVPASWVSETRATKPVRGIDIGWSWSEVVDLHKARVGDEASGVAG
ncbi:hypothetical protein M2317_002595 [Microbacterium sp. ZKA21]|uniref:hypothetical protein n=1 Tax=Microbacterium sp. ZKA21 TaxID=3381694 RepID=UPI003D25E90A